MSDAPTTVAWAADGVEPYVTEEAVRAAASAAMRHGGRPDAAVSVVLVREAELTSMHAEHLEDPTPTDVITFDLGEEGAGPGAPVGELYVSVDRALAVARDRGGRAADELLLYVVHGCLHLCGHDDHDEAERAAMRDAERAVLRELGVSLAPGPHEFGDA